MTSTGSGCPYTHFKKTTTEQAGLILYSRYYYYSSAQRHIMGWTRLAERQNLPKLSPSADPMILALLVRL